MLSPVVGIYGGVYRLFCGSGYPPDILANAGTFRHLYVWSGIWQSLGWNTIIYLAALSSVDLELHEAAQLDGANRSKRVVYIDLPILLPTAAIMLDVYKRQAIHRQLRLIEALHERGAKVLMSAPRFWCSSAISSTRCAGVNLCM